MKHTVALKQNHEFRRLYSKGKSAVSPYFAIYCRKTKRPNSRLGITTGLKLGNAVKRVKVGVVQPQEVSTFWITNGLGPLFVNSKRCDTLPPSSLIVPKSHSSAVNFIVEGCCAAAPPNASRATAIKTNLFMRFPPLR